MRCLLLNGWRGVSLFTALVFVSLFAGRLCAQDTITNVMSAVASYQFYDSQTDLGNEFPDFKRSGQLPILRCRRRREQFRRHKPDRQLSVLRFADGYGDKLAHHESSCCLPVFRSAWHGGFRGREQPIGQFFDETAGLSSTAQTVWGTVTDSKGAPVANATITATILSTSAATTQTGLDWSTTIIPFHQRQLFLSGSLGKFFHVFVFVMIAPRSVERSLWRASAKDAVEPNGEWRSWFAGFLLRGFLPGFLRAHALPVELQDDGVMHQAVNGRHGRHRILEDLVPFGEDQVAANHHAAPFIPLGQKREQHFHFGPVLLHVAQVVEHHHQIAVQLF